MSKRSELVRALPCIACAISVCPQPNATEEHHLNLAGKAGQKRRGDEYSIPLCGWHHRGESPHFTTLARLHYGPSLALHSKEFRKVYGCDDELLTKTNALLGVL